MSVFRRSSLDEVNFWLLIDVTEGKMVSNQFYQSREEISDWVDIVIVKSVKIF